MRKAIVYIFIFLLGLNSCGLDQLLKFPTLFSHYQEHTSNGTVNSFSDFLSMHYLGRDTADDDAESDRQLPFKSLDSPIISDHVPLAYMTQEFLHLGILQP